MIPFPALCTLLAEGRTFPWSPLMRPLFPPIKTRFFACSVHCDFIHFLFNRDICWCLVLHFPGVLIHAFETSGIFECFCSVSWSCSSFLLTLLDFPLSIMAISISVSNQPAGKSQCSPSALSFEMNKSQVSSFPCLMQQNLSMLYNWF